MNEVADFAKYKRRKEAVEASDDSLGSSDDVFWLAKIVRENLGNNLKRIGDLLGQKAIMTLVDRRVIPEIAVYPYSTHKYGFVTIARSKGVAFLCIENRLADMFLINTSDRNKDIASKQAALFSAGLLVAASAIKAPKVGSSSINRELWGRTEVLVNSPVQACFRFAGGVVSEILSVEPDAFKQLDAGDKNIPPQLAAMINPFNINEVERSLVPVC